jgi:hypothetical protein
VAHAGGAIVSGRTALCSLKAKPGIKAWSLNADSAPTLFPAPERLGPIAANGECCLSCGIDVYIFQARSSLLEHQVGVQLHGLVVK